MAAPGGTHDAPAGARRGSVASIASRVLDPRGFGVGYYVGRLQMDVYRYFFGNPEKTVEEERMENLAATIRTYRNMGEYDAEEEKLHWVDGLIFNLVMCFIILANAVVICLQFDLRNQPEWTENVWYGLQCLFCFLFSVELQLKLRAHGCKWLRFEVFHTACFIIVVLLLVDVVLGALYLAGVIEDKLNLQAASLIRVLGLVRLRHNIRKNKWLEELRAVFDGIAVGVKAIAWVVMLLTGLSYISALFLTTQIGHNVAVYSEYRKLSGGWDHDEYFGTIARSMYTLLQVMTLDGWSSRVVRHVINNQTYMIGFFIVFLLITNYGVVNIVVSVVVQHICATTERNEKRAKARENEERKSEINSMFEIFTMSDEDQDGLMDLQEFQNACQDREVRLKMRALELPYSDAKKLFGVLGGQRALTKDEFVEGCTKLKGPAQSKDLLGITAQARTLEKRMEKLCCHVQESERMLKILDDVTTRFSRRFEPSVQGARRRIARAAGGTRPLVPPPREGSGGEGSPALATGNRPQLPLLPDLLH